MGSPNIYNFDLWEKSGHAAHYKENMFVFQVEKQEFGLKPMNCPGALEQIRGLLCRHMHLLNCVVLLHQALRSSRRGSTCLEILQQCGVSQ